MEMYIGCRTVNFFVALLVTLCFSVMISGVKSKLVPPEGIDKELILTQREKDAFDKFKKNVYPHLFRDDLKHDIFLLRWLRAKNLNVDVAVKDLIGLKNFYFDNKIDKITEEEWSDFAVDYPVHMDAYDRQGRPVGYIYLREGWDFRASILQGKRFRMERYLIKIVFDLMIKLRDTNLKQPNVTQFTVLINLDGFSLVQQGCPSCLRSLISLLDIYERYLPGFSHEIIIVDAPSIWTVFYRVIRPVLSAHTVNAIKLFDTNKKKWMEYIHSHVDPNQLPAYFGGTKRVENDMK